MKRISLCCLFTILISSAAYSAEPVENGTVSLPKMSIVTDQNGSPAATEQKGNGQSLDDFYGRKRGKGKSLEAASGKRGKLAAPPTEDVYGEVPLPPTSSEDEFGSQVALPEVVQKAVMSRSDVNRIVCSEPIKDVIFSEEKGVISKFYGNSAYIKFTFDQLGDVAVYNKNPVELHVICGNTTYTLVAVPMPVPPQLIRLGSGKASNARENATMFKDSTTNKQIRELLLRAYKNDFPESFSVSKHATPIHLFRDLDITLVRTTTVDGEGVLVKEFQVISKVNGIELKEKHFLRRELSGNPGAIALEPGKHKPLKGEPVRVFIVEFKAENTTEGAAHVE